MISHSSPTVSIKEACSAFKVLLSGNLKGGNQLHLLEKEVARSQGYLQGLAVSSGTQAIHLAIRTLFPNGHARIGVQSYICRSVFDAIVLSNCTPVLLDIDLQTFTPNKETIPYDELDAIIVAHMFGIKAPVEQFLSLGIPVIEDCAQRITFAPREEAKGDARIISFEATKLITCGEGGMLLLKDEKLVENSSHLRSGSYASEKPAIWISMSDIQAAIARVQFRSLQKYLLKRRAIADFYLREIAEYFPDKLVSSMTHEDNIYFRFLFWSANPDSMIQLAAKEGVCLRKPVAPLCLHQLLKLSGKDYENSEYAIRHLISIPIYPNLTYQNQRKVAKVVKKLLQHDCQGGLS